MQDDICGICLDSDDTKIKTPCMHSFHQTCIKQLIRPFCPLCKKNITTFLIKNGVSRKKIKNNIDEDDYRILKDAVIGEQSYDECCVYDLYNLLLRAISINDKWKQTIKNYFISAIGNCNDLFAEAYKYKWDNNMDGVYFIYCFITDICENIAKGSVSSLVQWASFKDFEDNAKLKIIFDDVKNHTLNKKSKFSIVGIISYPDKNEKELKYTFHHHFTKNETYEYPLNKDVIDSLCSFKTYKINKINKINKTLLNDVVLNQNGHDYVWIVDFLKMIKSYIDVELSFANIQDTFAGLENFVINSPYCDISNLANIFLSIYSTKYFCDYCIIRKNKKFIYINVETHNICNIMSITKKLIKNIKNKFCCTMRVVYDNIETKKKTTYVYHFTCFINKTNIDFIKMTRGFVEFVHNIDRATRMKTLTPNGEIYV